jgi:hypothetical protein
MAIQSDEVASLDDLLSGLALRGVHNGQAGCVQWPALGHGCFPTGYSCVSRKRDLVALSNSLSGDSHLTIQKEKWQKSDFSQQCRATCLFHCLCSVSTALRAILSRLNPFEPAGAASDTTQNPPDNKQFAEIAGGSYAIDPAHGPRCAPGTG